MYKKFPQITDTAVSFILKWLISHWSFMLTAKGFTCSIRKDDGEVVGFWIWIRAIGGCKQCESDVQIVAWLPVNNNHGNGPHWNDNSDINTHSASGLISVILDHLLAQTWTQVNAELHISHSWLKKHVIAGLYRCEQETAQCSMMMTRLIVLLLKEIKTLKGSSSWLHHISFKIMCHLNFHAQCCCTLNTSV